jgi:hypothetical protein
MEVEIPVHMFIETLICNAIKVSSPFPNDLKVLCIMKCQDCIKRKNERILWLNA